METHKLLSLANIDEIPLIQHVAYATWPDTFGRILSSDQINYMLGLMYNTEELSRQINAPHYRYYLIWGDAGFVAIEFHHDNTTATKIHKLYLLPAHQGKGWGRKVIEEIGAIARAQGDEAMILNVNKQNPATGFYEKCGFFRWKSEIIDIGQGYVMDDYVYRLKLKNF